MNPRVVVDLRAIQSRHHGERGIGRYVLALARAIERDSPDLVTDYLIDPSFPIPPAASLAVASGKALRTDQVPAAYRMAGGVFLMASPFEEATSLETILPLWARGSRWRSTAVLYDLIPLLFPDQYLSTTDAHIAYVGRTALLRQADHLFAISETSKRDTERLLSVRRDQIDVIYAGADPAFERPLGGAEDVRSRLVASGQVAGLRSSFILFTGGPDYRKNISGLLAAYALLDAETRSEFQLVVVCKLDDRSRHRLGKDISNFGIEKDVLLTGFVDDRTLVALTQAAALVVFPSLYEGFGLPVLEAQQCGTPVICSDNSSLVEVQPLDAARFDPSQPESIAEAINRALTDDALRARLSQQTIEPRHTWRSAGQVTANRIRTLTASLPPGRRPTVTLIHAGEASAISSRAQSFIDNARDLFDIRLLALPVHDDPTLPAAQSVVRSQVRTLLAADPTDSVWWLASGPNMPPTFAESFRGQPGVLIIDNADMRSFYGVGTDPFLPGAAAALAAHYPGRYNTLADGTVDAGADASTRAGMLCTKELTTKATEVFCLSDFLGRLVVLDSGRPVGAVARPSVSNMTDLLSDDSTTYHGVNSIPTELVVIVDDQDSNPSVEVAIELALDRLRAKGHSVDVCTALEVHHQMVPGQSPATVYLFLPRMHYGSIPDEAVAVLEAGGSIIAERTSAFAEYPHPNIRLLDEGYTTVELADAILAGASSDVPAETFWATTPLAEGCLALFTRLTEATRFAT